MDPFLISAVGQIGGKLLDRILPPKNEATISPENLQDFSEWLEKLSTDQNNPLANYLQENGIDSWDKLENHLDKLNGNIREQLYSQIGYEAYGQGDWMVKANQGSFQLIDPHGEIHSVDSMPALREQISQLHNLVMLDQNHKESPGQSISELSSNFSPNYQGSMSWNL